MTLGAGGEADRDRLHAIASATDEATRELLAGLALPAAPRAVDVGAGTGSVACRLAADHRARVVALDRDTALLPDPAPAGVAVVRADLRTWAPTEAVDLVHARFVLAHLPERDAVVARLASWLAPGGVLVVTDPVCLDRGAPPGPVGAVLEAYTRLAEAEGLDFGFARRVPGLARGAGADRVEVRARPARLGGGPGTDRFGPLVERVADRLDVTPSGLASFRAHVADPEAHDVPQILLTTIATWPT